LYSYRIVEQTMTLTFRGRGYIGCNWRVFDVRVDGDCTRERGMILTPSRMRETNRQTDRQTDRGTYSQ